MGNQYRDVFDDGGKPFTNWFDAKAESISNGYWSARSAEFMQTETMQFWRWMRVVGDSIFGIGAFVFVWFALELMIKHQKKEPVPVADLAEA